jgi:hypothetical protein
MRGRSLRLDPGDPEKIASNWDVVCVAPELARGSADYDRFVRKHLHLFAPSEDGEIEAGPSHVHPALGPFAPPSASEFEEINGTMAARSAAHAEARRRWRIGEPYTAAVLQTLVVRPRGHARRIEPRADPPSYPVDQRRPVGIGTSVAVAAAVAAGRARRARARAHAAHPARDAARDQADVGRRRDARDRRRRRRHRDLPRHRARLRQRAVPAQRRAHARGNRGVTQNDP